MCGTEGEYNGAEGVESETAERRRERRGLLRRVLLRRGARARNMMVSLRAGRRRKSNARMKERMAAGSMLDLLTFCTVLVIQLYVGERANETVHCERDCSAGNVV